LRGIIVGQRGTVLVLDLLADRLQVEGRAGPLHQFAQLVPLHVRRSPALAWSADRSRPQAKRKNDSLQTLLSIPGTSNMEKPNYWAGDRILRDGVLGQCANPIPNYRFNPPPAVCAAAQQAKPNFGTLGVGTNANPAEILAFAVAQPSCGAKLFGLLTTFSS
jgi:hypothetical protein